jgi:hypothetical protein
VRSSPIPFAAWLPVFSVALWIALFAVPVTLDFISLEQAARGTGEARISAGSFEERIPRDRFLPFAAETVSMQFGHTIMAVNTPGTLVEALVSLPTTWPSSYRPAGILLDEWRCFSLPLFCMPAWWLVGIGLDGLVGRRRIHWSIMVLGTIFSILFFVLVIGLRFGMDASERAETVWPLWGLGLWAVLFAVVPLAWWQSQRIQRRQAKARAFLPKM